MSELALSAFGKKIIQPYSICYYPKMSSTGLGMFRSNFTSYMDSRGARIFWYKCSKLKQVGVQITKTYEKSGGFSGMTGSAVIQLWGYNDSSYDARGSMNSVQFVLPYIGASAEATMPYSCRYVPDGNNLLDGELKFNVAFGTGKAITDFVNSVVGSKTKIKVGPTDLTIPSANLTNTLYTAICCEYSGSTLISHDDNVRLQFDQGACVGNIITSSGLDDINSIDLPFEYIAP